MIKKNNNLRDKTLDELRDSNETLLAIHNATGLNLNWLHKFKQGVIKNPGIVNLQCLYEYLTGERL